MPKLIIQNQNTVKVNWRPVIQKVQKVVDWFMQITYFHSNPAAADPSHVNALKTLTSAGEILSLSFFAPPMSFFSLR